MQNIKPGYLIGINKDNMYYYYLILSEPVYFGCQWSYAFHQKSEQLLKCESILTEYGNGFQALINFNKKANTKDITIISKSIEIKPYQIKKNSKVRIDKPEGGHDWYIFSQNFQILRKQKKLNSSQMNLPVASGITCSDAEQLIDIGWKTEQIVDEEGQGQFPI